MLYPLRFLGYLLLFVVGAGLLLYPSPEWMATINPGGIPSIIAIVGGFIGMVWELF